MITSPQQRAILGSLTNSLLWSQHDPFHEDRALQTHLSARTPSLRSALGIKLPTSEHRWTQSSSPTVSVTLLFNQTWQKATKGGKYLFCLAVWGTASHHGGRRYGGAGPVNWQQRRWPNTVFLSPPPSEELKLWVNGQVATPSVLPASYPFLGWGGGRVLNQHGKANKTAVVSCLGWECFGVGLSLAEDHRQFDQTWAPLSLLCI